MEVQLNPSERLSEVSLSSSGISPPTTEPEEDHPTLSPLMLPMAASTSSSVFSTPPVESSAEVSLNEVALGLTSSSTTFTLGTTTTRAPSSSPAAAVATKEQKSILKSPSPPSSGAAAAPVTIRTTPPVRGGGKGVTFAKTAPAVAKKTRAPRKKVPLAMYQSQISDNKIGIKLCIKKSVDVALAKTKKVASSTVSRLAKVAASAVGQKKRGKKRKALDDSDSDEMNYRRRRRKESRSSSSSANNNDVIVKNKNSKTDAQKRPDRGSGSDRVASAEEEGAGDGLIHVDQSCWALTLPEPVLQNIFHHATVSEGCLPTIVKLSSVCSLWRRVAMNPVLWHTMDLTTWVKERHRNELKLKWFIENRLAGCTDLNLANWKVMNVQCVMERLAANSPKLAGLILTGWKALMSNHLMYIATEMKNLQRIDLTGINTEVNANKTAVGLQSLSNAVQAMGERLKHIHLANNRLGGLPQLINSLATHCPNLILLDLSNISTMAVSHAVLPLEKLQTGCPKLKVFRITNAQVTLGPASLQEQMDSPGFVELEELSIASFSRTICDEFVQRILKNSTKLKLLDVRGCPRITHDSLIRLPAWDLKHLFLSGCQITRDMGSGLELIASKWAHSLVEFDLAWGNAQKPLDSALRALAEKRSESRLNHLDLCGSSVSLEAVKEVLESCPNLNSINLSSCRSLPRGMKRLLQGPAEMKDLREALGVELKVASA